MAMVYPAFITVSSIPKSFTSYHMPHNNVSHRSRAHALKPIFGNPININLLSHTMRTSTTVSSATKPPPSPKKDQQQPTAQDLAKLYGGSYLGTSIAMSIVSFAVLYALVYIGVDVRSLTNGFGDWLGTTPLGRPAALDNVSDAASAAAIAYVAHKVTSPLRFPLTIAATPLVARIFSPKQHANIIEDSENDSN